MIDKALRNLGIPETAIKVYRKLVQMESTSARYLAEHLGLPRPTVYDALKVLQANDLIYAKNSDGKSLFAISDLEIIPKLLGDQIETLEKQMLEVKKIIPKLKEKTKSVEPKIRFFTGASGVKKILSDLLWYSDLTTYSLWPMKEMLNVLGAEYLEKFNIRRSSQKLKLKAIRQAGQKIDFKKYPYLGVRSEDLRELRFAPKWMKIEMSYWIYADKVAFISNSKELFGFIVHSSDFANLMQMQFEAVWRLSKSK